MKLNFIKYLFGWKEIKLPDEPCILVYGHTSYWDAFFYFLYRISSYGENMYILVQPKLSKWYYRPFALLLNMIFAPPIENKSNNTLAAAPDLKMPTLGTLAAAAPSMGDMIEAATSEFTGALRLFDSALASITNITNNNTQSSSAGQQSQGNLPSVYDDVFLNLFQRVT